jgi:hypothetical protein
VPTPMRRVRLCMKDLYHQDLVEMVERETRQFQIWEICDPDDPLFPEAFRLLWEAFGAVGEMEREDAIRQFLADDSYEPVASGTYVRYFLLVARDKDGSIRGVRDGSVLVNPAYARDLCVVFLSHIYMRPEARGTVLSYWLRIAPVELAMNYLAELHARGKIELPNPDQPHRYFGMRMDMAAEMEFYEPEDRVSWQRILFYGRGGFDVINPRHFPYLQPDFRDPEEIRQTGNQPVPFMMLVRRMGREMQAQMTIEEASALMRLIYDDFACHCSAEFLDNSLQRVLDRLAERAKAKQFVELLPLPTDSRNLPRLRRLFRYTVYSRYYRGASPAVRAYLDAGIRTKLRKQPRYLEDAIASIAAELDSRPSFVFGSRDKRFTFSDQPIEERPEPSLDGDPDETLDIAIPADMLARLRGR